MNSRPLFVNLVPRAHAILVLGNGLAWALGTRLVICRSCGWFSVNGNQEKNEKEEKKNASKNSQKNNKYDITHYNNNNKLLQQHLIIDSTFFQWENTLAHTCTNIRLNKHVKILSIIQNLGSLAP